MHCYTCRNWGVPINVSFGLASLALCDGGGGSLISRNEEAVPKMRMGTCDAYVLDTECENADGVVVRMLMLLDARK